MRVALLSDIHGNAPALRSAMSDLKCQQVDSVWVLGDILGYGPLPITCINMLDELQPECWLMGNHDMSALLLADNASMQDPIVHKLTPKIDDKYINLWHAEQLKSGFPSKERINKLNELPTWQRMKPGIYAAHGAILSKDSRDIRNITGKLSYCRPFGEACQLTLKTIQQMNHQEEFRLVVVGHTHIPAMGSQAEYRKWTWVTGKDLPFDNSPLYSLKQADAQDVILCPGSVGFSRFNDRDRYGAYAEGGDDKRGTYAIIDLEEFTVCFRRISYSQDETRAAMVAMPEELANQIRTGEFIFQF